MFKDQGRRPASGRFCRTACWVSRRKPPKAALWTARERGLPVGLGHADGGVGQSRSSAACPSGWSCRPASK